MRHRRTSLVLAADEKMLAARMQLAQDGDRQAYELVLEHCGDAFDRLARERCPAGHSEVEIVQACLLTLHHARHTFDPDRSFSAWVGGIARRHGIGARRSVLWKLSLMRFERHARTGLRLAMVVVFLIFGSQKFTAIEAMGIAPLVSHSPLTSWLISLGVRDMSRIFGTAELSFGLLLATGLWREDALPAIVGAAGSCVTFLTTLSFLLTTPGVFAKDAAPVLSSDGLFLVKDLVLLSASVLLLAQSLAARQGSEARLSAQGVLGP